MMDNGASLRLDIGFYMGLISWDLNLKIGSMSSWPTTNVYRSSYKLFMNLYHRIYIYIYIYLFIYLFCYLLSTGFLGLLYTRLCRVSIINSSTLPVYGSTVLCIQGQVCLFKLDPCSILGLDTQA